jgi:uncharacterized protein (DUF427 family)
MKHVRPGPGQESVWEYPRPPRAELEPRHARIVLAGTTIASSHRAMRVLETSHPPGIYLPSEDFIDGALTPNPHRTGCEWKGMASYWDLHAGGVTVAAGAWSYESPSPGFEVIAGFVSVYPGRVEACFLGDEQVRPQEGGFYGGWITDEIVGPFKGAPGTWGW